MTGIIHSIIWLVCCCFGSGDGIVVIFCWTHMDTPTITGRTYPNGKGCAETGYARSMLRNALLSGTLACAGFHQ